MATVKKQNLIACELRYQDDTVKHMVVIDREKLEDRKQMAYLSKLAHTQGYKFVTYPIECELQKNPQSHC